MKTSNKKYFYLFLLGIISHSTSSAMIKSSKNFIKKNGALAKISNNIIQNFSFKTRKRNQFQYKNNRSILRNFHKNNNWETPEKYHFEVENILKDFSLSAPHKSNKKIKSQIAYIFSEILINGLKIKSIFQIQDQHGNTIVHRFFSRLIEEMSHLIKEAKLLSNDTFNKINKNIELTNNILNIFQEIQINLEIKNNDGYDILAMDKLLFKCIDVFYEKSGEFKIIDYLLFFTETEVD